MDESSCSSHSDQLRIILWDIVNCGVYLAVCNQVTGLLSVMSIQTGEFCIGLCKVSSCWVNSPGIVPVRTGHSRADASQFMSFAPLALSSSDLADLLEPLAYSEPCFVSG